MPIIALITIRMKNILTHYINPMEVTDLVNTEKEITRIKLIIMINLVIKAKLNTMITVILRKRKRTSNLKMMLKKSF